MISDSLLFLFGMGGLALWAGSEAVLPAHLIGLVLAGTVGKGHVPIRAAAILVGDQTSLMPRAAASNHR